MSTFHEITLPEPRLRRPPAPRLEAGPVVLVPLDGHERSLAALPVARALAEMEGATIHVLHASDRPVPLRELAQHLGLQADVLFGTVIDELTGPPADSILEFAASHRRARIVMVAHSEDLETEHVLGPVTEDVLSRARCPVFLVPAERKMSPWGLQRLVIPHDGDPVTASAFGPAIDLADAAGASLFVLHVASLTGAAPQPGTFPVPTYVDQPQHEWPEWAREFLERMELFCQVPSGMHPRLFLAAGAPGEEILRFVENHQIDLVAIAWHGTLASSRAETVKEVIHHATCPVLFMRAETEERGELH